MSTLIPIEEIHISHLPPTLPVYAALYTDVQNAGFLHEQLLAGNEAFEYAFIDARVVVSRQHALAAVFRAAYDWVGERLRSRNVHSEVVFALGVNNNIGEAFRRFGVSAATTELLVFKIPSKPGVTRESVQRHLDESVEGEAVSFDDANLGKITDLARVRKVYKLGDGGGVGKKVNSGGNRNENGNVVDEKKEVEVQVLGLMALRGSASGS